MKKVGFREKVGKRFFLYMGILLPVLGIMTILLSIFISVDGYVPASTGQTILMALLDVDVAFLGFYGLMLVYLLKSIDDIRDRFVRESFEIKMKKEELAIKPETKNLAKMYNRRLNKIIKRLNRLNKLTPEVCESGVMTICFLMTAILASVLGIGKMSAEGLHYVFVFVSLFPLLSGISFAFGLIIVERLEAEYD